MAPGAHEWRADVQGLRAVAVALVFSAHVLGVPAGGFVGVDVFFCISGFLITSLIIREKERSGGVSLRAFYARRARRILPVALIVLVATNVAARVVFAGARVHQTFVDSVWALVFGANIHFAQLGTSYFEAERPRSALLHFWSLAVEEQFYLVWPCLLVLALLVARRFRVERSPVVVGVAAAVVVVTSFAFALRYTATNPAASYFATATRAWELGVGAMTAALVTRSRHVPERLAAGVTWAALGVIVVAAFVIDEATPFPGVATLAPVLATAAILGVGQVPRGVGASWALGWRPWQFLGGISYSLYLWHWPAMTFAEAYYGKGTGSARAVAGFGSLALATLTYVAVEQSVRVARRITPLALVPTGVALLGTALLMSGTTPVVHAPRVDVVTSASDPVPSAPVPAPPVTELAAAAPPRSAVTSTTVAPSEAEVLARLVKASVAATAWGPLDPPLEALPNAGAPEWKQDDCLDVDESNAASCVYGNPAGTRTAMLLGDSIALSYLPGIRTALSADWRIHVLTLNQCPMVDAPTRIRLSSSEHDVRCTDHRKWVRAQVDAARPDMVILSSAVNSANQLYEHGAKNSADNAGRWRDAFGRELARLVTMASRVVVIGSPTGTGNLQECVTQFSSPSDCAVDLYPFWGMIRDAESAAAAEHAATYVDPLGWFCADGVCPAVVGSTPVNWDGAHLTAAYSRRLGPVLAPFLHDRIGA